MDLIIKNAKVLKAGEQGRYELEETTVCIDGGTIVSIGIIPDGTIEYGRVIDATGQLMLPGFVNAHTHAYMTILRNRADDLPFDEWLFGRIMPAEEKITPENAYWSSMLSIMEMLSDGITAFLDMHMFPGAAARAALESGMRAVISRGLSGGEDDATGGERRLREAQEEISQFGSRSGLGFMLAPHSPYTCDEGYLREISSLATSLGIGINTHLAESRGEINGVFAKHKSTPIGFFDRCGLLGSKTVAAHCVHLTKEDMELLKERGVSIALCPVSNLKLANGTAPVPELLSRGLRLCLGTDSAASNNSLSLRKEMWLVALQHKGLTGDPTAVTASETLDMATKNGALALGLERCGEIREGFMADLSLFDLNAPSLMPLGDPAAAMVYSGSGMKARTVIVGGRVLLENGEFTTIDAERVSYEANAASRRIFEK